ncbi:MAG: T9SS type A sorting domain-containing protein [Bacteroidetes bacterium]|nr:T9SS type A sorting domain-containing protein [Bacteroidota bacterium]
MKKNLHFIAALFMVSSITSIAQNKQPLLNNSVSLLEESNTLTLSKVKHNDSLSGFNEQQARDLAPLKGITAEEMDVYMAISRRDFIKSKYNLVSKPIKNDSYSNVTKLATASCVNEDFEEQGLVTSVPAVVNVTTTTDVNGWTVTSGVNTASNGSCVLGGCCTSSTGLVVAEIGIGSSGYVDAVIGASYPIFSVFGNNANNGSLISGNPTNMRGDWIVRVNNQTAGAGISRITKSFIVSPANAKFKFASIAVAQGAHCCCDNVGIAINFKDCLGNMLATSGQFSVSPSAGPGCTPTGPCTTGAPLTFTNAAIAGWVYNKWRVDSVDLSFWIGSCISIEVTGIDCPYSGHAGYAYFDAQCSPIAVSSGVSTLHQSEMFNLYPNPNNGSFNLDIAKPIQNGEIEIRNILGQVVMREEIKQGSNKINSQNLLKGIYTYAVLQNKEVIHIGKVIIE